MDQYVALDVSLKETSVCVLDAKGSVLFEGRVASEPTRLVHLIRNIWIDGTQFWWTKEAAMA